MYPFPSSAAIIDLDISVVFQLALFLLLLAVLNQLVFKPLLALFQQRRDETDGKQEEARQAADKAGQLLDSYGGSMAEASAEGMAIRSRVRDEAVRREAEALARARSRTSSWYEGELAQFSGELAQARTDARAGVSRLSGEIVDLLVSRSVDDRRGDNR